MAQVPRNRGDDLPVAAWAAFVIKHPGGHGLHGEADMQPSTDEPLFWTIEQAARATGLSRSTLYRDARQNKLPGLRRYGRALRIDRAQFLAALEDGEVEIDLGGAR